MKRWLRRVRSYGQPKAMILMYHRIDELTCDPWQLAVNPAHFEQQLRVIREHWNPISLAEMAQGVAHQSVIGRGVVLTFDDGYIDNFEVARPLLERYNIPATFFITTQNVERQALFWWDELQEIILNTQQLPREFDLVIGDEQLTCAVDDEAILTPVLKEKHHLWSAANIALTKRSALYLEIWRRLRPLPDDAQQRVMTQLRKLTGQVPQIRDKLVCMTPRHIQQLTTNSLFSVGAHTVTHPALADHPADEQQKEISGSKSYLETLTARPITFFAYPYGSYTNTTVDVVKNEQLSTAVTTNEGLITKRSQALQLNRYQVNNWSGPTFKKQLAQWYRN